MSMAVRTPLRVSCPKRANAPVNGNTIPTLTVIFRGGVSGVVGGVVGVVGGVGVVGVGVGVVSVGVGVGVGEGARIKLIDIAIAAMTIKAAMRIYMERDIRAMPYTLSFKNHIKDL